MNTIIIGSGGHAGVVIQSLSDNGIQVCGLIDDFLPVGAKKWGTEIIGTCNDFPKLVRGPWFIAVGDNQVRLLMAERFRKPYMGNPLTIRDSSAYVAAQSIGIGTYIGPRAVVGNNAVVGEFCIINSNSTLEHDSEIGNFVHLCPGVVTGGKVKIGDRTFIGLGSVIRDRVSIGSNCIIGMGSVVTKDVPDHSIGWGNPWKSQGIK